MKQLTHQYKIIKLYHFLNSNILTYIILTFILYRKILMSNNLHVNLSKQYAILILLQYNYHRTVIKLGLIYMTKSTGIQHGYTLITTTNIHTNLLTSNLVSLKLSVLNFYIINYLHHHIYKNIIQILYQTTNALNATKQIQNFIGSLITIIIFYKKLFYYQ